MTLLLQKVSNRHILKTRPPKNKLVLCTLEIGCYFPVVCNIFLYPKILITKTSIRWWLRNVSQSSSLSMLPKHHKIPSLNKTLRQEEKRLFIYIQITSRLLHRYLLQVTSMGLGASHCTGVWAPTEVSITTMVIAIIFVIATVPGNLMVILAVLLDPNKNLRSPFTLLIANLAVTDLIVGALVEPLSINTHYREAQGLSISMSWFSQSVYFLCCTASLLSLAALTVDRYLAITKPLWYRANTSYLRVGIAAALVWIFSSCFTSLFFIVGFVAYAFVFANITMFCTIFIFFFSYIRIFQYAKNQIAQIDQMHDSQSEQNKARQRAIVMENKLTKTYLIMLAVFLSCYIPSCIMIYLMNLCHTCSCELIHWLRDFHFVFITVNSLINPFLYAFRLPNFKSAVKRMLCGANQVAPALPAQHSALAQNHADTGHGRNPSQVSRINQKDIAAWENQVTRDASEATVSVPN